MRKECNRKTRLRVGGTMTPKGADRVGAMLALAAIIGVTLGGIALVIFVAG